MSPTPPPCWPGATSTCGTCRGGARATRGPCSCPSSCSSRRRSPGSSQVPGVPGAVPDPGGVRGRAGRRRRAAVGRARLQPPGRQPPPLRRGRRRATTVARCRAISPRCGAARRRALHRPGGAGLRLRATRWACSTPTLPGCSPAGRGGPSAGGGPGHGRRAASPRLGWAWNQAMLDLGATVCRRRRPRCEACPVRPACAWVAPGLPSPIPPSAPRACPPVSRASRARTARGGAAWSTRCAAARSPTPTCRRSWAGPTTRPGRPGRRRPGGRRPRRVDAGTRLALT